MAGMKLITEQQAAEITELSIRASKGEFDACELSERVKGVLNRKPPRFSCNVSEKKKYLSFQHGARLAVSKHSSEWNDVLAGIGVIIRGLDNLRGGLDGGDKIPPVGDLVQSVLDSLRENKLLPEENQEPAKIAA